MPEWPMAAAAVTFLVGFTVQVIVRPHGSWSTATNLVMSIAWGIFVLDYVARLCLAGDVGDGSSAICSIWPWLRFHSFGRYAYSDCSF